MDRDAQPAATALNSNLYSVATTGLCATKRLSSRWPAKYTSARLSTSTQPPAVRARSSQSRGAPLKWLWYDDSAYICVVMVYSMTFTASVCS
eukprot:352594-Chlamydomonas_euryale.AAC.8